MNNIYREVDTKYHDYMLMLARLLNVVTNLIV